MGQAKCRKQNDPNYGKPKFGDVDFHYDVEKQVSSLEGFNAVLSEFEKVFPYHFGIEIPEEINTPDELRERMIETQKFIMHVNPHLDVENNNCGVMAFLGTIIFGFKKESDKLMTRQLLDYWKSNQRN